MTAAAAASQKAAMKPDSCSGSARSSPRVEIARDLLAAARDRGEIRPGADIEAAAVLLMGALQSQRLYRGEFPDGWEERIVDTVLGAMLR